MKSIATIAIVGAVVGLFVLVMAPKNDRIVIAAKSAMLQAMERGYLCHASGRMLEDCQNEQRRKWEETR